MNHSLAQQASDVATEILAADAGYVPEPDWHNLAVSLALLVYAGDVDPNNVSMLAERR